MATADLQRLHRISAAQALEVAARGFREATSSRQQEVRDTPMDLWQAHWVESWVEAGFQGIALALQSLRESDEDLVRELLFDAVAAGYKETVLGEDGE